MSSPTDVIVICEAFERDAVAKMQAWCAEEWNEQQFGLMPNEGDHNHAGGGKFMSLAVYAMGGNYIHANALAEALPSFGWKYPHQVILISRYYDTDDDMPSVVYQYYRGEWYV